MIWGFVSTYVGRRIEGLAVKPQCDVEAERECAENAARDEAARRKGFRFQPLTAEALLALTLPLSSLNSHLTRSPSYLEQWVGEK